jgi:predicted RNase H-like HicB family nuclease
VKKRRIANPPQVNNLVNNLPHKAMVDFRQSTMRQVKIIVEKHTDGYVAYPLGLKGVVVGEGSSFEEALADVKSAIRFHIETFGAEVLPDDSRVLDAFVAEATIPA